MHKYFLGIEVFTFQNHINTFHKHRNEAEQQLQKEKEISTHNKFSHRVTTSIILEQKEKTHLTPITFYRLLNDLMYAF